MVSIYSLANDGDVKLSANFRVREFACNDGSDDIYIDSELVDVLQKIRTYFKRAVIINSGYRTPTHDKKVGGSGSGYHTKGCAADIVIRGVSPAVVALYASSLLENGGIECADYQHGGYVHIDVRAKKWRAVKAYVDRTYESVSDLFPTVKNGSRSQSVVIMQRRLNELGFNCGSADGICGKNTVLALRSFQTANSLVPDGICGTKSWAKLMVCDKSPE